MTGNRTGSHRLGEPWSQLGQATRAEAEQRAGTSLHALVPAGPPTRPLTLCGPNPTRPASNARAGSVRRVRPPGRTTKATARPGTCGAAHSVVTVGGRNGSEVTHAGWRSYVRAPVSDDTDDLQRRPYRYQISPYKTPVKNTSDPGSLSSICSFGPSFSSPLTNRQVIRHIQGVHVHSFRLISPP